MGIREAILEDWKRQGHQQGLEQGLEQAAQTKKEFEEKQKLTILNLQKEGFSNQKISTIMRISVDEVLRLIEEK